MKKIVVVFGLLFLIVEAKELRLSQKEIATWGIKTEPIEKSAQVPLGKFIVEVTTPPNLIRTISLPFKAQVVSLNAALYQKVEKGDLLAKVTGTEWIEAQKSAISDAIELRHHTHTATRKNKLCREEIIPKKDCIAANAELRTDKIKVAASKALLKSYGASERMIKELFEKLTIFPAIPVKSPIEGTIVELNAHPGKSTPPSSALFVIQKEGAFWLESDLPLHTTRMLDDGDEVLLDIDGKKYRSSVLQIAPTLNLQNQTRHVRFSLKPHSGLLPGLRVDATLIMPKEAYRVPKVAVVKHNGKTIVFARRKDSFVDVPVEVIGEDRNAYYLTPSSTLGVPIVVNGVAVLKNMLGEGDE